MRREDLYFNDLIEAADHIAEFVAAIDFATFAMSEMLRSAVVQKLSVIGEAAARISIETKARYPEVPWTQIVAFRNILVHAYFGIDWEVVWLSATRRCPILRQQVAAIRQIELSAAG